MFLRRGFRSNIIRIVLICSLILLGLLLCSNIRIVNVNNNLLYLSGFTVSDTRLDTFTEVPTKKDDTVTTVVPLE